MFVKVFLIYGFTLEGALWVIRARFQGNKAAKCTFFFINFRSDFKFGNKTHTVCGVTSFQGLPAFLSRSSECCGRTNFFTVKMKCFDQFLVAQATKMHLRYSDKKANA